MFDTCPCKIERPDQCLKHNHIAHIQTYRENTWKMMQERNRRARGIDARAFFSGFSANGPR